MAFRYPVVVQRDESDDKAFTVEFPDFPEATTFGRSVKDALIRASDCLDEVLSARVHENKDIPAPSRIKKLFAEPSLVIAAKVALHQAVLAAGMKKTALARSLDLNENEVRRMLDPRHPTKLGRIEEAMAVLGKRFSLTVVDV